MAQRFYINWIIISSLILLFQPVLLKAQVDTARYQVRSTSSYVSTTKNYLGWDRAFGQNDGGINNDFIPNNNYNIKVKINGDESNMDEFVFSSFEELVLQLNKKIEELNSTYRLKAIGQDQILLLDSYDKSINDIIYLTIEDKTLSRWLCNDTKFTNITSSGNVFVRWGPANYDTWEYGNIHGYNLIRYKIKENGIVLNDSISKLTKTILETGMKPKPASYWETLIDADSTSMAGILASTMFGDSLDMYSGKGSKLMQVNSRNEERQTRLNSSLFVAEQSFSFAQDMGWGYIDNAVSQNSEYFYVIELNEITDTNSMNKGFTLVHTDASYVYPVPSGLYTEGKDKIGFIYLPKGVLNNYYSSFSVLRSDDNGITYHPISSLPQLSNTSAKDDEESTFYLFTDTFPQNNYKYIYKIKGKTAFGTYGPLSDTVSLMGKPGPLEVVWSIDSISEPTYGKQRIFWNFPDSLENKITGFRVQRSYKPDDFTDYVSPVIAVNVRSFFDEQPLASNYYSIEAYDINGYTLVSNVLLGQPSDTVPPAKPVIANCTCTKGGRVTVSWNANTEPDLSGYKVFMANDILANEYTPITGFQVTDTSYQFFITNQVLNRYVYFKVKAFDNRYNPSIISEPCTVLRPDGVPPVAPVITEVKSLSKAIYISWALSVSEDADKYELQRRPKGVNAWLAVKKFDKFNPIESITDTVPNTRVNYDYRLVVWDESKNLSTSAIVRAKADVGILPPVELFSGQYIPALPHGMSSKKNYLEWHYRNDDDLVGFQILRALDSSSFRSFKFINKYDAVYPPNPSGLNSNPGNSNPPLPSYLDCKYNDTDLDFTIPIRQSYVNFNGSTPSGGIVSHKPVVLLQRGYTMVHYKVYAKFADGSMSQVSSIISLTVPNN